LNLTLNAKKQLEKKHEQTSHDLKLLKTENADLIHDFAKSDIKLKTIKKAAQEN
jgi:hypothetical protein